MVYAVLGALLIGFSLGLFGSGGSILTVPVLVYLLGHEEKTAIAESLLIVGSIALVGAAQYAMARLVVWKTALALALPGILGTVAGAQIASLVPGVVQLMALAGVMLVAAFSMWRSGSRQSPRAAAEEGPRPGAGPLLVGLVGVGVGMITGFVGVGGGFLILPALVLFARLDMKRAVATSLLVIAINAGAGFWRHAHFLAETGRELSWTTIGVFIAVGVAGSVLGKRLNTGLDQRKLKRGFAVFVVVMAVLMAGWEAAKLAGVG